MIKEEERKISLFHYHELLSLFLFFFLTLSLQSTLGNFNSLLFQFKSCNNNSKFDGKSVAS